MRWERLGTRRPHNWSDTNLRAGQRVERGERGGEGVGMGRGYIEGERSAAVLFLKHFHSSEVLQISGLPVFELQNANT